MKKGILILVVLIGFLILLTGCFGNKEKKIDQLKTEANVMVKQNQYEEAIEKYEQIISIKDDKVSRKELFDIKTKQSIWKRKKAYEEKTNAEIMSFIPVLQDIQRVKLAKPKDEINFIDLYYILEDLKGVTGTIKDMTAEGDNELSKYVEEIQVQHQVFYSLLKLQYDQDFAKSSDVARKKDIEIKGNFGGELGAFLDTMNALDSMTKDSTIGAIDDYVNHILNVKIPSSVK
ncbi:hypothetical protein [Paenibacillus sp. HB172176]|uniref:hypothetical protein n=1 Tax=Paenibacillus sp. HB172176 TaxID=2493690 RepID=UPI001439293D|nr:hypothetical protein [Paenibacillus sp. HB172176]